MEEVATNNGYGKWYHYPQLTHDDNTNFDEETGRTKTELYTYFKAKNTLNSAGYKSKLYGLTYYDGYGYNYYTNNYGYYEYSRPPVSGVGPPWEIT